MRDLVIDRKKWLRGEPGKGELLRADDGKMCCLGFYLKSLRVPERNLMGNGNPADVACDRPLPASAKWLVMPPAENSLGGAFSTDNSEASVSLMTHNDAHGSDAAREKRVAAIFAKHDVRVTFTN